MLIYFPYVVFHLDDGEYEGQFGALACFEQDMYEFVRPVIKAGSVTELCEKMLGGYRAHGNQGKHPLLTMHFLSREIVQLLHDTTRWEVGLYRLTPIEDEAARREFFRYFQKERVALLEKGPFVTRE